MEQQKAMRRRRRKKDIDLINDNDDAIAKMIADMRLAAREDREKNADRQPATKKISMLPGKDFKFLFRYVYKMFHLPRILKFPLFIHFHSALSAF